MTSNYLDAAKAVAGNIICEGPLKGAMMRQCARAHHLVSVFPVYHIVLSKVLTSGRQYAGSTLGSGIDGGAVRYLLYHMNGAAV